MSGAARRSRRPIARAQVLPSVIALVLVVGLTQSAPEPVGAQSPDPLVMGDLHLTRQVLDANDVTIRITSESISGHFIRPWSELFGSLSLSDPPSIDITGLSRTAVHWLEFPCMGSWTTLSYEREWSGQPPNEEDNAAVLVTPDSGYTVYFFGPGGIWTTTQEVCGGPTEVLVATGGEFSMLGYGVGDWPYPSYEYPGELQGQWGPTEDGGVLSWHMCAYDAERQADYESGTIRFLCDSPDRDGDTIPDYADNCPDIANVEQADWDLNGVGTPCDRWEALVHSAHDKFVAEQENPDSAEQLGYYYQVLNIVCAAARSMASACAQMMPYYVDSEWSEDWVHDVFEGYLHPFSPHHQSDALRARVLENAGPVFALIAEQCADGTLRHLVPFGPMAVFARWACPRLAGDLGTLGSGAPHFANELDPWFKSATRDRLMNLTPSEAVSASCSIRNQQEMLFETAVASGFSEVGKAGYMSPEGVFLAQHVVPPGAGFFRDRNLIEILDDLYGEDEADRIYRNYTAACGSGGIADQLPSLSVEPGQILHFLAPGGTFVPGAVVDLILSSDAELLAQASALSDGSMDVLIPIPEHLEPGAHTLYAQGLGAHDKPTAVAQALIVATSTTADYDGDGSADPALFRPSNGRWYARTAAGDVSIGFGLGSDIPVAADYDGDGITDPAVFRPSNGRWYARLSGGGPDLSIGFGLGTDIVVPGDYDGDGIADPAVFRPSNGRWYARLSGGAADLSIGFGLASDIVVPGDYDGDGLTDPAVYRPSNGRFYVRTSGPGPDLSISLGLAGDVPVPADWDGDGDTDPGVFRPSGGRWISSTGLNVGFGLGTDIPLAADYDGDGIADPALFRPSNGRWYVRTSSAAPDSSTAFGLAPDIKVAMPHAVRTSFGYAAQ